MAGIDKKEVNDTVPQMQMIECLTIYKISDKIMNFITNAGEKWRVELTAGD